MQETRVQSLGLKGPLEKEMAAHSNILVSKSYSRSSLEVDRSWGDNTVRHDLVTNQQKQLKSGV